MTTITPEELGREPLHLLKRVEAGERIRIVRGTRVVAEITPVASTGQPGQRPDGLAAGQFRLPDDSDAPLAHE